MANLKAESSLSEENREEEEISKGPVENAWALSIPEFNKGDMKHNLQEESKFEVAFPKYREKYIRECWPLVQKLLDEHGIKADLDLMEGVMSVSTTRKTWDPYIILKARDIIKLLGRSVPLEHAAKVIQDGITCEIIKIKNIVRNKERLIKRRQRLIGSNGSGLQALELLTNCYVLVQGCTVSTIGPHKGVQQVMRVVLGTMNNIHPINLLKTLMVKKCLAKDPKKKDEDWSKYIPSYSSTNVQTKKPKKIRKKKPYTPFPPERTERKVDEQMNSGQYFVEMEEKGKKWQKGSSEEKKKATAEKQKLKRNKAFIPPQEPELIPTVFNSQKDVDIGRLKKKVKTKSK